MEELIPILISRIRIGTYRYALDVDPDLDQQYWSLEEVVHPKCKLSTNQQKVKDKVKKTRRDVRLLQLRQNPAII
jgi:hypothetical protein